MDNQAKGLEKLMIDCDNINIDTSHNDSQISLELTNPFMQFIQDIPIKDIISYIDNKELLKAIVDNDIEVLQEYLKENNQKLIRMVK